MKPYIIFNNEKRTECSKNKDKMSDYIIILILVNNLTTIENIKILELQIMKIKLKNWLIK